MTFKILIHYKFVSYDKQKLRRFGGVGGSFHL